MDLIEKHSNHMSLGLPSQEMMYKLMRACICVDKIEDLWIYELSNIPFNGVIDLLAVQSRAKGKKKK